MTFHRWTNVVAVISLLRTYAAAAYTLPQDSSDPLDRAAAILTTQLGFTYGAAVAGGPYYPSGALGTVKAAADQAAIQLEVLPETALSATDTAAATAGALVDKYDGLKTVNDYTLLYNGEWTSTLPKGPVPGILTNYTQDLLFSMERLSNSPYAVRRLNPSVDTLAFDVDESVAQLISGSTLQGLLDAGRLFYVDHSAQGDLARVAGRYAPACDAYFYISETSGEFLPLAIRTGVGANLIYTPQDEAADWLLAKMMFSINDSWFVDWFHLASTHEVVQIVWMAAIRTLSVEHPVYALLNRLTYQVFAIQPIAASILFNTGGTVDQIFGYTGAAAQDYTTNLYFNGGAGNFEANYFLTNLQNRGLINSTFGPELTHFPFYEDASTIYTAIKGFMTTFVESYYSSASVLQADTEIQAWAKEANGAANISGFPESILTTETLVDILTQMAHLVSTAHHTSNTNDLLSLTGTLPLHPAAFYQPLPTTKGNTSVVDFLPPLDKCVEQLAFSALFARPLLVNTSRSLLHMFDDPVLLAGLNADTAAAAVTFQTSMQRFSEEVGARGFDDQGLSQGMPFVWQTLDPNVAPYSITT
ncbi:hypothetical protein N0V93_004450 [Gnomoniopsis smithogilvyi]|uniref:Manganese lipoxygenase n=1 Tax=Gnomoniopsis smithogilvyi TaxID=1191159 RepID=A0A9W8YR37_9PEZI|nr:hypothetical protein N0V93_004450 [Gnomoniopsis smithogilvyi]